MAITPASRAGWERPRVLGAAIIALCCLTPLSVISDESDAPTESEQLYGREIETVGDWKLIQYFATPMSSARIAAQATAYHDGAVSTIIQFDFENYRSIFFFVIGFSKGYNPQPREFLELDFGTATINLFPRVHYSCMHERHCFVYEKTSAKSLFNLMSDEGDVETNLVDTSSGIKREIGLMRLEGSVEAFSRVINLNAGELAFSSHSARLDFDLDDVVKSWDRMDADEAEVMWSFIGPALFTVSDGAIVGSQSMEEAMELPWGDELEGVYLDLTVNFHHGQGTAPIQLYSPSFTTRPATKTALVKDVVLKSLINGEIVRRYEEVVFLNGVLFHK